MITKSQENFIGAALVGGAVGAVIALLFTPVSGAELRQQVRDGLNHNGVRRKTKLSASSHGHVAHPHPARRTPLKRTAKKKVSAKRKHAE